MLWSSCCGNKMRKILHTGSQPTRQAWLIRRHKIKTQRQR